MYYLKLLFILSPAFSRQNKVYSNYYQVSLDLLQAPHIFFCQPLFLNIKPIIRLECIKIIEGIFKAIEYMHYLQEHVFYMTT